LGAIYEISGLGFNEHNNSYLGMKKYATVNM